MGVVLPLAFRFAFLVSRKQSQKSRIFRAQNHEPRDGVLPGELGARSLSAFHSC